MSESVGGVFVRALGRLAVGLSAVSLASCGFGASSQSPSSHFVYPNSNVIPLGAAEGTTRRLCGILFVNWGTPDADDQDSATRDALEASGGDLIINVRTDTTLFFAWFFSLCTTHVRGIAAKMEIGRQQLGPGSGAAPPLPPPTPEVTPVPPVPPPPPPPRPSTLPDECATNSDCKGGLVCRKPVYAGEHQRKCVAP